MYGDKGDTEFNTKFKDIKNKSTAFMLGSTLLVMLAVLYIGVRHEVFTSKIRLYFVASDGYNITVGQPVKLSGIVIGKVSDILLDDVARVRVELTVYKKYMKWIKYDSKARLFRSELLGDAFIIITPGSADSMPIDENAALAFERDKGVNELVSELGAEITDLMQSLSEATDYIASPTGNIQYSVRNVHAMTVQMLDFSERLNTLALRLDERMDTAFTNMDDVLQSGEDTLDGINGTVVEARSIVADTDKMIQDTSLDIGEAFDKLDASLERLDTVTQRLDQASEHAPDVMQKSSETLQDASEMIDSAKKGWPLRVYMDKPEETTIKVDSNE